MTTTSRSKIFISNLKEQAKVQFHKQSDKNSLHIYREASPTMKQELDRSRQNTQCDIAAPVQAEKLVVQSEYSAGSHDLVPY